MPRLWAALGIAGGLLIVLSSAAHTLLGWPGMTSLLMRGRVGSDAMLGLKVAWQFGGIAMLAFGVITIATFAARSKGRPVSLFPAYVIAALYLSFGAWALAISDFSPFFAVFLIPGLLIGLAAFRQPAA